MEISKCCFPFSALIGLNAAQKALLIAAVNPSVGGVLLSGSHGTGKSTLVRSFCALLKEKYYQLPLSISEDRLIGTVELEQTLACGKITALPGLLSQATGGMLYVDDVELLAEHISDMLSQAADSGECILQREGICQSFDADFVLLGTTSRAEDMRKSLLEQFGLFAELKPLEKPEQRLELVRLLERYERNPAAFCREYEAQNEEYYRLVQMGRENLPQLSLSEENLQTIVQLCTQNNVEGHRADILLGQAALALAAMQGTKEVTAQQIQEAAVYVLPHRVRQAPPPPPQEPPPEQQPESPPPDNQTDSEQQPPQDSPPQENDSQQNGDTKKKQKSPEDYQQLFPTGADFKVVPIEHQADRKPRRGSGRRSQTKTDGKAGRYLYATERRRNNDLALDATIRAAAPFQPYRDKKGLAIRIHREDIREKVRQRKIANLLVFVVDASGSMGAQRRMSEAKGAVLSLLKDAYVKRDKVAMISFRKDSAKVLLPPTRSTERGYALLQEIETGGKTPLNAGLEKGLQVIAGQLRQTPDIQPLLIVITDGRGNVSVSQDKKPMEELMDIGSRISKISAIDTLIVDIEKSGVMSFGIAKRLADATGGRYYKLDQLRSNALLELVSQRSKTE